MSNDVVKALLQSRLVEVAARVATRKGTGINETTTRNTLIQPILSALGWPVEDDDLVEPEWKYKQAGNHEVDYALKGPNGKPVALVEAKALDVDVSKAEHVIQAVNYAQNAGVPWAVLTNGEAWRLYRSFGAKATPIDQRLVWQLRVADVDAAARLAWLSRARLCGGALEGWLEFERDVARVAAGLRQILSAPPDSVVGAVAQAANMHHDRVRALWTVPKQSVVVPSLDELESQFFGATSAVAAPSPGVGQQAAKQAVAAEGDWLAGAHAPPPGRKPRKVCVGGAEIDVTSWKGLLVAVARHIAAQQPQRFKDAQLHTDFAGRKSRHVGVDSKGMREPVKVGSGFVETHLSAHDCVARAVRIVEFVVGPGAEFRYALAADGKS